MVFLRGLGATTCYLLANKGAVVQTWLRHHSDRLCHPCAAAAAWEVRRTRERESASTQQPRARISLPGHPETELPALPWHNELPWQQRQQELVRLTLAKILYFCAVRILFWEGGRVDSSFCQKKCPFCYLWDKSFVGCVNREGKFHFCAKRETRHKKRTPINFDFWELKPWTHRLDKISDNTAKAKVNTFYRIKQKNDFF